MNLKDKLRESLKVNIIETIWITDMDGTLINTATPDWGKPYWEKKTGTPWPHVGWWGRIESIDPSVFPNDVIPQMQGEYNKVKNDPTVLKVVMTGRMEKKFGSAVKQMLDSKGLVFDVYALNTGGETADVKVRQMTELLSVYPNANKMVLFEDRGEHFAKFETFGNSLDIEFELVKVVPPEVRF